MARDCNLKNLSHSNVSMNIKGINSKQTSCNEISLLKEHTQTHTLTHFCCDIRKKNMSSSHHSSEKT